METSTLTFLKGMDTDTANALRDGTSYVLAKNFTITDGDSGEFGSLTNVKGNKLSTLFNSPDHNDHTIVGYTNLRNNIIIFTTNSIHSYIWEYNPELETLSIVYSDENSFITDGSKLNFSTAPEYKIVAVGSYEKDNVQKIYWTDGKEILRYLNIKDPNKPTRVQDLNIIPIGKYTRPTETEVLVGGNLKAGRIQYCYRLVNKYGSESSFSDCTDLISLTKSVPNGKSTYYGSDRDDIVNKSVTVTMPGIDSEFEIIRLYSVFYDQVNSVPKIRLVAEVENPGPSIPLKITDVGEILEEVTLVEFNTLGGRLFTAEALETKDNILFAGGISENEFSVDLDCRAYSFCKKGSNGVVIETSDVYYFEDSYTSAPVFNKQLDLVNSTFGASNLYVINNDAINFPSGSYGIKGNIRCIVTRQTPTSQGFTSFKLGVYSNPGKIPGVIYTYGSANTTISSGSITLNIPINDTVPVGGNMYFFVYSDEVLSPTPSRILIQCYIEDLEVTSEGQPICKLYNDSGTLEYTITTPNTSDSSWNIPLNADAINRYTDVYTYNELEYKDTEDAFKYKSDGITLGGSGKIVSYNFIDYKAYSSVPVYGYNLSNDGYTPFIARNKENIINNVMSFKRGEVYRCGIQFFDVYGKPSFTNWIADIRIPYTFEWDGGGDSRYFYSRYSTTEGLYCVANPVKISFSINTSNIPSNVLQSISGYKIVTVKREYKDRTVIAQGVAKPARYDVDGYIYFPSQDVYKSTLSEKSKYLFDFHSPDIYVNRNDIKFTNSKFRVVSYMEALSYDPSNGVKNNIVDFESSFPYASAETNYDVGKALYKDYEIKDIVLLEEREARDGAGYTIKMYDNTDVVYKNRPIWNTFSQGDYSYQSYGPTSLLLSLETTLFGVDTTLSTYIPIVDIVLDNFKSRFGGNSYYARLRNTYTSASKFVNINTTTVKSIGDTFTTLYSQMIAYADFAYGNKGKAQGCISFPVESSINTLMIKDRPGKLLRLKEYYDLTDWGLQESKVDGVSDFPLQYPDSVDDLYKYNSVYSQVNQYPTFSPKPLFFEEQSKNDTMIVASEKKINGELVDNWTKFLYSNLIELPTNQGKITNLKTVDTKLMCWQEKGVSVIAVNDRYLLSDNPGQLALGSGGILERYDYLTTECGATGKYVVDRYENAILWIDSVRHKLFMYDSSIKDLTVSKGIRTHIKNIGDFVNPTIGVDMKTNKIYFKLKDDVLVFDLMMQVFEGVRTYNPKWFIRLFDNRVLSSNGNMYLFTENEGDKAEFFNVVYPSYIKTRCVDNFNMTKVFDTLEWYSKTTRNVNGDTYSIFDDTFSRIRVTDDYQNTDWQPLNYRRSERTFRSDIPRDIVNQAETTDKDIFNSANLDATQLFKRRILDRYINIELEYDNDHSYSFTVPYINVNYRVSNR